jgi:hypothetical protein
MILAAPYVTPTARMVLQEAGFGYIDNTGNTRIQLSTPGLFLRDRGADLSPSPPKAGLKSLKGPKASRAVRALVDFTPPYGVRELSSFIERSGEPVVPPYTVSRTLGLLRHEGLVEQNRVGTVVEVDWRGLLRRWALDYALRKPVKTTTRLLAIRGLSALERRLAHYDGQYALTGRAAVHQSAREAGMQSLTLYVDDLGRARDALDLMPPLKLSPDVGDSANVVLLEASDEGIFARRALECGLGHSGAEPMYRVAYSQLAVDLLTGPGRHPQEAEALMTRMAADTPDWRRSLDATN